MPDETTFVPQNHPPQCQNGRHNFSAPDPQGVKVCLNCGWGQGGFPPKPDRTDCCKWSPTYGHEETCPAWRNDERERELRVAMEREAHWRDRVLKADDLRHNGDVWVSDKAFDGLHTHAQRSFTDYLDREWKMKELWGYELGDAVEARAHTAPRAPQAEWELGTVTSFSAAGGIRSLNVQATADSSRVIQVKSPNNIRRWERPSNPEDIEKWLLG
jgi:hypothetical protein